MVRDKNFSLYHGVGFIAALLLIETLIKQVVGTEIARSVLLNPVITAFTYLIVIWGINKQKYNYVDLKCSKSGIPRIGFVPIILSLFLFLLFVLEIEAFFKLGFEEYKYTFNNNKGLIRSFISVLVIVPIFEEIFFRKKILRGFISTYGINKGIWFSAILFALLHYDFGSPSTISKLLSALLIGIFFSYVFMHTGSIKFTIFMHVAWNLLNYLKTIFIVIFDIIIHDKIDLILFLTSVLVMSFLLGLMSKNNIYKLLKNGYLG